MKQDILRIPAYYDTLNKRWIIVDAVFGGNMAQVFDLGVIVCDQVNMIIGLRDKNSWDRYNEITPFINEGGHKKHYPFLYNKLKGYISILERFLLNKESISEAEKIKLYDQCRLLDIIVQQTSNTKNNTEFDNVFRKLDYEYLYKSHNEQVSYMGKTIRSVRDNGQSEELLVEEFDVNINSAYSLFSDDLWYMLVNDKKPIIKKCKCCGMLFLAVNAKYKYCKSCRDNKRDKKLQYESLRSIEGYDARRRFKSFCEGVLLYDDDSLYGKSLNESEKRYNAVKSGKQTLLEYETWMEKEKDKLKKKRHKR